MDAELPRWIDDNVCTWSRQSRKGGMEWEFIAHLTSFLNIFPLAISLNISLHTQQPERRRRR